MSPDSFARDLSAALGQAKSAIVLQARMSSQRLPGKMLLQLGEIPLVQMLLDRFIKHGLAPNVWLATSTDATDDPLADYVRRAGLNVFRGDLADVAGRLLSLARQASLNSVVRISGDSPFMDARLVAKVFALSIRGTVLTTNVFPRSFPKGQSAEVIPIKLLEDCHPEMTAEDREHVTSYFYRNHEQFPIVNHSHSEDVNHLRMVVDTKEDWARLGSVASRLVRPHWEYSWQEIASHLEHNG